MKLFSAISDGVDWSSGVKIILIVAAAVLLAVVVALLVAEIVGKRKRRVIHENVQAAEPVAEPAAEPVAEFVEVPAEAVEEIAVAESEPQPVPEVEIIEPAVEVAEYAPDEEIELTEDAVLLDEGEDTGRVQVGATQFKVRYNRSFTAKLIQSDDILKGRYSELKNELMRYSMKPRMSWTNESFYKGRVTYAKFAIRGKTLSLYLALEPAEYAETKYKYEDASEVAKYAKTPMRLKLKSNRSVRWAKELIAQLAAKYGLERVEREEEVFRPEYEETTPLVARKLIKLYYAGERIFIEPEPRLVEEPVPLPEPQPVPEAEIIKPEVVPVAEIEPVAEPEPVAEVAEEVVEEVAIADAAPEKPYRHKRKSKPRSYNCRIISTGKLNANFDDGEEVTLQKLIEKNIFSESVIYYKVLFVGEVTKSLTVVANEFSAEAQAAIVNAGGTIVKI